MFLFTDGKAQLWSDDRCSCYIVACALSICKKSMFNARVILLSYDNCYTKSHTFEATLQHEKAFSEKSVRAHMADTA